MVREMGEWSGEMIGVGGFMDSYEGLNIPARVPMTLTALTKFDPAIRLHSDR